MGSPSCQLTDPASPVVICDQVSPSTRRFGSVHVQQNDAAKLTRQLDSYTQQSCTQPCRPSKQLSPTDSETEATLAREAAFDRIHQCMTSCPKLDQGPKRFSVCCISETSGRRCQVANIAVPHASAQHVERPLRPPKLTLAAAVAEQFSKPHRPSFRAGGRSHIARDARAHTAEGIPASLAPPRQGASTAGARITAPRRRMRRLCRSVGRGLDRQRGGQPAGCGRVDAGDGGAG